MKKTNKKGFTIVELVIVIAVIAILAAVLIPTFTGVIEKANQSAVLQAAKNAYTSILADDVADGLIDGKEGTETISLTGFGGTVTYTTSDGEVTAFSLNDTTKGFTATLTISTGAWTVTKNSTTTTNS